MNEQMKVWAHDYALKAAEQGLSPIECVQVGWKYAEAMQAQAEQRRAPEPDFGDVIHQNN